MDKAMKQRSITYNAEEYSATKGAHAFRECVEKYTIFTLVEDPKNLSVVDMGCGDGIYARTLADLGASHVIGIDCAGDFIKLAEEKSKHYGGKIEYRKAFIQDCSGSGDCDLAVGSYILNYAKSMDEATEYCKAIASFLKPGGRFIGFNNNPFEVFRGERYAKYGFIKIMNGNTEGEEVVYKVDGMTNPIINYYLNPKTHEKAFQESGLELEWQRVLLDPSDRADPYWDYFFDGEPPFIAMFAKKIG